MIIVSSQIKTHSSMGDSTRGARVRCAPIPACGQGLRHIAGGLDQPRATVAPVLTCLPVNRIVSDLPRVGAFTRRSLRGSGIFFQFRGFDHSGQDRIEPLPNHSLLSVAGGLPEKQRRRRQRECGSLNRVTRLPK